uniref:OSJNBb0002J11.23 protein n=1 Tax=Oryza sativa subsp. japonica TaxID=39947 RepID=Q7F957_ORYSJ|nr:OSJNBb0002J11.23 [Oryza sativa Japonica Group]
MAKLQFKKLFNSMVPFRPPRWSAELAVGHILALRQSCFCWGDGEYTSFHFCLMPLQFFLLIYVSTEAEISRWYISY